MNERREPLQPGEMSALDALANEVKVRISTAAGIEAIDVMYRVLVAALADKLHTHNSHDIAQALKRSTDGVVGFLEQLPNGTVPGLNATKTQ